MKQFFSLLCLLGGLAVSAQKTVNDPLAAIRQVSSFHGIEVATGIELTLVQGSTQEVAVSAASAEFRDKIITKVENGILKIQYESKTGSINRKKETKDLKAYVSCTQLDRLYATTGAEVEITGTLQAASLDLKANTGASIQGKVAAGTLKLEQNTGSKVNLSGSADKLEAEGSTGSKFTGEDLASNTCHVQVSTGAKISIHAEKELQAKASTGGMVRYKGNAGVREVKTNTGGSVSKI